MPHPWRPPVGEAWHPGEVAGATGRDGERTRGELHGTPTLRRPAGLLPLEPGLPIPGMAPPPSPTGHVWVTTPRGERVPGLAVEWRDDAPSRSARVVYMTCLDGLWVTVEEWVPSAALTPA